jgi:putative tryptophan/tyrosine transport system substrate-binding protein
MNRRKFIGTFAGVLSAAPLTSFAQQPAKVWRIGFLVASSRQAADDGRYDEFLHGMRGLGYVEGKNLAIEWRFANGNYERLPGLAAELVQLKVDLILAAPSPAIRAAQQATTTIPIVFPSTGDPVGSGFAASLARPGSNLTGLSNFNLDVSAKTLELLTVMIPKLSRVAVLANPGSSTESAMLKSIEAAAQKVGVRILSFEASTPEEIERALITMGRDSVDAVVIAADALLNMQRRQIAELAIKVRLPSISQGTIYAKAGGLMSYGQDSTENYRRAAEYVDKILKGAKPGELPIEQPTRLSLLINLKTAKALGLTVPQSLLLRADEVIQ